jgi:signal transduction histidine kinase
LLENVVSVTLLVFLLVTVALVTFASRITLRIRRLRDASERAIGPEGRLRVDRIEAEAQASDEIGDLSRSISEMLGRLTRHTRYLESMPDTLAHELSNPLNVVSSSLENLQTQVRGGDGAKYIDRALNGISRLRHILTGLTEAANLEDALRTGQQAVFDLRELVSSAVEGYRVAHPDRRFVVETDESPAVMHGIPESIAQLLDKLVDNAVDFGHDAAPIVIRLQRHGADAVLEVINEGDGLPADMRERIFDPMVSVGKKRASQSRLGLGLYVVRLIAEFHHGTAQARNREDDGGVVVTVRLPMTVEQ